MNKRGAGWTGRNGKNVHLKESVIEKKTTPEKKTKKKLFSPLGTKQDSLNTQAAIICTIREIEVLLLRVFVAPLQTA